MRSSLKKSERERKLMVTSLSLVVLQQFLIVLARQGFVKDFGENQLAEGVLICKGPIVPVCLC